MLKILTAHPFVIIIRIVLYALVRYLRPTLYIKYGFIAIQHYGDSLPQCVICMKTLSNAALKPGLLRQHLESNHAHKMKRDKSYFEQLGENAKNLLLCRKVSTTSKGKKFSTF